MTDANLTLLGERVADAWATYDRERTPTGLGYYQGLRDAYLLMGGLMSDLPDQGTWLSRAATRIRAEQGG